MSAETESFICGGFGGICAVLVGHPLDTIKVRLQTMPIPKFGEDPHYSGTLDCVQKTIKNEGILGLYKGMSAPLTTIAPIFATSFMGFKLGQRILTSPEQENFTSLELFLSGAFAGAFTVSIMAPGERIKTLLQIQETGPKVYNGFIDCIKKLLKEGGIASLYRGTGATLAREVPASGTYFLTYETIQALLTNNGERKPSILGTIFAGGCSGITFWIVGMPPDVLKSRIQAAPAGTYPKGMRDAFKKLIKFEGPAALYTGLTPVILRAIPANAGCFFGFEMCKQFISFLVDRD